MINNEIKILDKVMLSSRTMKSLSQDDLEMFVNISYGIVMKIYFNGVTDIIWFDKYHKYIDKNLKISFHVSMLMQK